ncbi:MAG: hypothetical protein C5B50_22325 [Verrucomicrobia bacterium]|nr:MAG: hypothetical protein C5B50_22325 [Verrucomicrobiota bacterium]
MKTLIPATSKARRSLVPITSFEFETFEVHVRPVTRQKALPIGASLRTVKGYRLSRRCKNLPEPINAVHGRKIFISSPSIQGPGPMRLQLEARPALAPAALPSGQATEVEI